MKEYICFILLFIKLLYCFKTLITISKFNENAAALINLASYLMDALFAKFYSDKNRDIWIDPVWIRVQICAAVLLKFKSIDFLDNLSKFIKCLHVRLK